MFEYSLLLFLLLIVFIIVIQSLIIGISPMPSSKKVAQMIVSETKHTNHERVIDLGSGFGSLAILLAVNMPNKTVIGYEQSFFPWLVSICLKYLLGIKNLYFYRRNFLKENLSNALLVCYLFPKGMEKLEQKFINESESFELLSSTFAFRHFQPQKIIQCQDWYNSSLYYYLNVSHINKTT